MKPLPFLLRALAVSAFLFSPLLRADEAASALTFIRATELADKKTSAQTLCAEFRPADGKGAAVWLIGVAHLGTAEYYRAIQQRLDRQTVVLYEGIGIEDVKAGPGQAAHEPGIQAGLAKALGLVFQLDAIDYRRPHFINSDLKADKIADEVREKSVASGGSQGDQTFDALMGALQGTGEIGKMMNGFVATLGKSAEMQETTKAVLVEVLGRAGELIALAQSSSPAMKDLFDVILAERNTVVLADLRKQLARRKAGESVAIFYGAAHMDELAKHLRDDLHYVSAKQEWETAFTADPAKGGINPGQIRLMLELMKMQLKAAQPAGK